MRRSQFFAGFYHYTGAILLAALVICLVGGLLRLVWRVVLWVVG